MKAYTDNKARVSAIIQIPALKEETYGRDFSEMLQERLTFDEALADSALTIMTRQRLKIVKTPALPAARQRGGALMASDDKIEELIREIAAKHGIAVGRDDPILILQTINERLMQDSQAAQQEILDRFTEELEVIAHRWGDDAKQKAERTLNAALAASKEAMAKGMQDGGKAAAEAVRRELERRRAARRPIREARRVSYMNMVAAGMAVFAAALALWATL